MATVPNEKVMIHKWRASHPARSGWFSLSNTWRTNARMAVDNVGEAPTLHLMMILKDGKFCNPG